MSGFTMLKKSLMGLVFAAMVVAVGSSQVKAQAAPDAQINRPVETEKKSEGTRFDKTKYAHERVYISSAEFRKKFPILGDEYEVEAESTGYPGADEVIPPAGTRFKYNCIAWALRIVNRPVWEGDTATDFDRLFGEHGYVRMEWMDLRVDPQVEKIALYANFKADGKMQATHASRQLPDGTWTSKLGGGAQIRHRTPDALSGPCYGTPIALYVKVLNPGVAK